MGGGQPRLELHHGLKCRERVGRLRLGQMDPAAQQESLDVGRVLLQNAFELGDALVVTALHQRDLGETTPGGQILRVLRRDIGEHGLGGIALTRPDVEVGELHSRQRAVGRQIGGRLQLLLGATEISRERVELRERGVRLHRFGVAGDGLLEGLLRPRHVALLEIERAERDVKARAVGEHGPNVFQPEQRGIDVLRPRRRVGQEHEGREILRVLLEDGSRMRARIIGMARHEIHGGQLEANVPVLRLELGCLSEVRKRVLELPGLVVRQSDVADRHRIGRFQAQDVPVLDDGVLVGLPGQEFLPALQVARLLGFRGAGTAGAHDEAGGDQDQGG